MSNKKIENILFSKRCRRGILIAYWILLPLMVFGAFKAMGTSSNRSEDWLPQHFQETQQLYWFVERFGNGEILVISWEDCTFDDPHIEPFAAALREAQLPETEELLFRLVLTGPEMEQRLAEPPLGLTSETARRRMSGWLAGPDRNRTGIMAVASETGSQNRQHIIAAAYEAANTHCDLSKDMVYLGGTTVDSVAIDEAAEKGILQMNIAAYTVIFILSYVCFRSWIVAGLIFGASILAEAWSLANLYYTGTPMDSISLLMASVVYVLSISAAVHLVNYYREAANRHGSSSAAERAVRAGILPCGLATITTAIGLGSLGRSQIVPISKFGIYASVAVVISLGLVFLIVPAAMKEFPPRGERFLKAASPTRSRERWRPLFNFIHGYYGIVAFSTMALFAFTMLGVTKLETTVRLHDMFPSDAKIIHDYDWIEHEIGNLVPLEVILRVPTDQEDMTLLDRITLVNETCDAIETIPSVGAVISVSTFLPDNASTYIPNFPIPDTNDNSLRAFTRRYRIDSVSESLKETTYFKEDDGEELWRISVRVAARREARTDYETLLEELKLKVDPVLMRGHKSGFHDLKAEYAGGIPLVHKAQRQLLDDLITSFLTAFVLVAFVMMLVMWVMMSREVGFGPIVFLRGFFGGLIVMIPNLMPMVLVFGMMGWLGRNLDMGTMMTASVALGIAVDDTLHFIIWFRRGLRKGKTRGESVFYAYRQCGMAMVQTSAICGLGLFMYSFSGFNPISNFAYLMFILLGAALFGDLIVLPSLLLCPLGKLFVTKTEE
jgi:uncharacterized protein